MQLTARRGDPVLDTIARSVYALFPRCMRCGAFVARFEDADVRILANRVVHRFPCHPEERDAGETADPSLRSG